MNEISAIVSALTSMNHVRVQEQIAMSVLKMNAEAEAALADMLIQNAREIASLADASVGSVIDIFA
ncbi:MAG TPA: putative motility protein [Smithellaceae bacterium]|nr:putative motility protein [Smithellaceae bacterium]